MKSSGSDEVLRSKYITMTTEDLASECRRLKRELDDLKLDISLRKASRDQTRAVMRVRKIALEELKTRQLQLF